MQPRLIMPQLTPDIFAAMRELNDRIESAGLDPLLSELIKIRASQINHCAYCIDMHTKDARAIGETEQRIYALSAWRETPFFTERERAALALTEAVTVLTDGFVPDDVYERAAAQFDEKELAVVIWAVIAINALNRMAVTSRSVPGSYRSTRTPR
ncbi:MAG: carboxymuconolactone decarboxylase family protein [Actinocatenispora sp.]